MLMIRSVESGDAESWTDMRHALWPEGSVEEHREDVDRFFEGHRREPQQVLLAIDHQRGALGFVELSIRNIVDGCGTDNVGYLEGWYVKPSARRQGVGRSLIRAAEQWASERGCLELGSDALIENAVSLDAHKALGFEEVSRVCTFRKALIPRGG
jgi:aminoglycoside 6'-N-acetyltransferase I